MIKRSGTELEMDQNPLMTDIGKAIGFDFMDQNMDQNDPSNNVKVLVGKASIEVIYSDLDGTNSGTVNSHQKLLGISTENRIAFSQKIVEKIYEILPSEQKYVTDEI
ncbi:MAG TPA: hypothetical protein VGB37_10650, partial [Candidatus Lokiarchaeia archaeon]